MHLEDEPDPVLGALSSRAKAPRRGRRRHLPWEDHQSAGASRGRDFANSAEGAASPLRSARSGAGPALGKKPVGQLGGLARGEQDEEPASGTSRAPSVGSQRERGRAPFPLRASRPISAGVRRGHAGKPSLHSAHPLRSAGEAAERQRWPRATAREREDRLWTCWGGEPGSRMVSTVYQRPIG